MPSLRCTICAHDYPQREEFKTCPVCGDTTTAFRFRPMPEEAAQSILNHARFERYYEEEHTPDLEPREDENVLVA